MLSAPSEMQQLEQGFFFLLFFPPLPKELTIPVVLFCFFFFSGHFSAFVSVHTTQHITITHTVWSHCFSNENQNREDEPSKKLKQIPPHPPKQPQKPNPSLFFLFKTTKVSQPKPEKKNWNNPKEKTRERLEGGRQTNRKPNINNPK